MLDDNNEGCRMSEFMAEEIEYDNFSLEMFEVDFFKKLMESSSLLFVPVNSQSNTSLYDLKI